MSKKIVQKKTQINQRKLLPAKTHAKILVKVPDKVPVGKITMTPADIRQMLILNQELKRENNELKAQVAVLEKTLLSAGIEVDEKFGDNEDHVIVPTLESVKGYKDLDNEPKRTSSQIMENQSEMDDDSDEYGNEYMGEDED
jgi:hypothetical protein